MTWDMAEAIALVLRPACVKPCTIAFAQVVNEQVALVEATATAEVNTGVSPARNTMAGRLELLCCPQRLRSN